MHDKKLHNAPVFSPCLQLPVVLFTTFHGARARVNGVFLAVPRMGQHPRPIRVLIDAVGQGHRRRRGRFFAESFQFLSDVLEQGSLFGQIGPHQLVANGTGVVRGPLLAPMLFDLFRVFLVQKIRAVRQGNVVGVEIDRPVQRAGGDVNGVAHLKSHVVHVGATAQEFPFHHIVVVGVDRCHHHPAVVVQVGRQGAAPIVQRNDPKVFDATHHRQIKR